MNYEEDFYNSGNYSSIAVSAQGGLYGTLFHSMIEKKLHSKHFKNVLEVGGLDGQHINYVKHSFDTYTITDIVSPDKEFDDKKFNFILDNIENSTLPDSEFDRVLLTCVLHHLNDPYSALKHIRRIAKKDALISILLPIDPGWAYKLAIELTSIRKAKKMGMLNEARRSRALGHRNHFDSLKLQIMDIFKYDQITFKYWPNSLLGKSFNIFSTFQIIKN